MELASLASKLVLRISRTWWGKKCFSILIQVLGRGGINSLVWRSSVWQWIYMHPSIIFELDQTLPPLCDWHEKLLITGKAREQLLIKYIHNNKKRSRQRTGKARERLLIVGDDFYFIYFFFGEMETTSIYTWWHMLYAWVGRWRSEGKSKRQLHHITYTTKYITCNKYKVLFYENMREWVLVDYVPIIIDGWGGGSWGVHLVDYVHATIWI